MTKSKSLLLEITIPSSEGTWRPKSMDSTQTQHTKGVEASVELR